MLGAAVPVRMLAGLLFITGYYEFWNLAGAFLSSPWTMESFGGDPGKNASARSYVKKTAARGMVVSGAGVLITGVWWPLIGTAIAATDLWLTYNGALGRSEKNGSVSFQSPSGDGWKGLAW
jgi:formate hydrogenlyase subunit 3/multisubunit Na+/H+ antiporter MnhD subunit